MTRAWFAAPLLTVVLFVVSAASASAADEGDSPMVVSADQSGALGVVSTAQSDVDTDPEDGTDRRLVGRESSERVDAIVIALWSIAAGMTVMLGIFLWHTSPRRRLRLARRRTTQLYEAEGEESGEPAGDPEQESVEEERAEGGFAVEGPAGDSEQESVEEEPAEEERAEGGFAVEGPAGDSEQESVRSARRRSARRGGFAAVIPSKSLSRRSAREERAEGGFAVEGPAGDSEQESVDDGSEGSPSLWMLARRTGMRLIRWMGS